MKTKTKFQKFELLVDTALFYNLDNRCVGNYEQCKYFLEGKAGCAIGRLIKNKKLAKRLDSFDAASSVVYVFKRLPDYLKGYGMEFLQDLQDLHDVKENWTDHGLSKDGKKRFNQIKKTHCV